MDSRVSRLKASIDSHTGAVGWNLENACRELKLDISSAYAARLFRRETGVGIREYAKQRRLLIAAGRLAATGLPIKRIATELGYRQASAFTRSFKKQYLLNPTRFRRQSA
jgi:AraC-like DNA-binding protein